MSDMNQHFNRDAEYWVETIMGIGGERVAGMEASFPMIKVNSGFDHLLRMLQ